MTDTPIEPQDVVIKPPPATVYAKANVPIGIVMTVRGTVEKLTADGASDQAIVEAIRQESPELAEVVEANTPKRPQGIDAHEWIRTILAVYMAILVTYATLRAEASPPSVEEIAQIVEDVLSKQRPAPPP